MNQQHWAVLLVLGAFIGIFVGLFGTSGALTIPILIYALGLSQLRAQGTALFIAAIPVWLGPLLPYARAGHVDWRLGLLLACGLAVGGYYGAAIAQHLPVTVLRRGFAIVLCVLAVRMFLQR